MRKILLAAAFFAAPAFASVTQVIIDNTHGPLFCMQMPNGDCPEKDRIYPGSQKIVTCSDKNSLDFYPKCEYYFYEGSYLMIYASFYVSPFSLYKLVNNPNSGQINATVSGNTITIHNG